MNDHNRVMAIAYTEADKTLRSEGFEPAALGAARTAFDGAVYRYVFKTYAQPYRAAAIRTLENDRGEIFDVLILRGEP